MRKSWAECRSASDCESGRGRWSAAASPQEHHRFPRRSRLLRSRQRPFAGHRVSGRTAGRGLVLRRQTCCREVNGVRDERSDRTLRIAGRGSAAAQLCKEHKRRREWMIVLVGDTGLAIGETRGSARSPPRDLPGHESGAADRVCGGGWREPAFSGGNQGLRAARLRRRMVDPGRQCLAAGDKRVSCDFGRETRNL